MKQNMAAVFGMLLLLSLASGAGWGQPLDFRAEFNQAEQSFLSSRYQEALLHYKEGLRLLPDNTTCMDLLLRGKLQVALCYYFMRDEISARLALVEYVRSFPASPYVEEAKSYLAALSSESRALRSDQQKQQEEFQAQRARWERQLSGEGTAYQHYILFDLNWKLGEHGKACTHIEKAIALDPSYAQRADVKDRIMVDRATGRIIPRDPSLDPRRQMVESQLVIRNVHSYQQSSYDLLGDQHAYVVTGEVNNDGIFPVDGVALTISILNLYEQVLDTRNISIGDLNAFESRPFKVTFTQFGGEDNSANVKKVKVQPTINAVMK